MMITVHVGRCERGISLLVGTVQIFNIVDLDPLDSS